MKNPFHVFIRAAGIPRGVLLVALLPVVFPALARADGPVSPPALEFASGLPGKQVRLTWAAQPGQRYRIEKSTSLGAWSQIALVEPAATNAVWLDPEPTTEKAFYRVMQPQAEVFSISLPVLSTVGGDLRIHGQLIPPGSSLVIQIPGQAPILVPLSSLGNGEWQALVSGNFDIGADMMAISIVDSNGVPIVTLDQPIEVTLTGLATESAPSLPPASPTPQQLSNPIPGIGIVVKKNKGVKRPHMAFDSGDDDDCDGGDPFSPLGMAINEKGLPGDKKPRPWGPTNPKPRMMAPGSGGEDCDDSDFSSGAFLSKKGYDYYQAQSQLNSAFLSKRGYDYYKAQSDMSAASAHTNPYFVSNGNQGEMPGSRDHRDMGPGAISAAPSGLPGEVSFQFCALSLATPAGPPLEMIHTYRSKGGHGGGGAGGLAAARWESCYDISIDPIPLSAGSSATRVMVHDGGGRADVFRRQADGTYRCDGMFREGRFDGDVFTLTFADKGTWTFHPLGDPNASGKIAAITDRNNVALACAYNGSGQLETVSSQFGQSLTMTYGSDGSLGSVSDQTGRSVYYTYCGPQDPDGNAGDLKTISAPQTGPSSPFGPTSFTYLTGQKTPELNGNLLSITDGAGRLLEAFTYAATGNPTDLDFDTCDSHNRNKTGHVTLNRREINPTTGGYTVFEVDEIGRLTETDFDRLHRIVACREFTGFCTPNVPVTASSNRPTGKLHASDPDYFETTCAYNADSLCTRVTEADGSRQLVTYDRDFRRDCAVRERGNARVVTLQSPGGEMRTVTCDYLPDFGTPESAKPGNPIGGLTIKGGRNPGGNIAAISGKGWEQSVKGKRKGWDGSVKGKRVDFLDMDSDDDGVALLKKEEGGRHTPFHNKYRPQFSSSAIGGITGGVIAGIVVASATEGGHALGLQHTTDGGIMLSIHGHLYQPTWTRLTSAHGQVFTRSYDASGNCISATSPLPGKGSLYQYNAQGQITGSTVLNGQGSSFTDECVYDSATHYLSSVVCDSPGLHITTSIERDNLGRVTRTVDPLGNDWLYGYNSFDECVQAQSPAMPNRISMNVTMDAGGRVCRCDVEHRAPDGSLDATNPVYSTFFVRDDRCRVVQIASEERPVNSPPAALAPALADLASYDVCDLTLDNSGQVIRVSTPAACRNQAADGVCDFTYNERGLLDRCAEGGLGTAGAVTTECEYDSLGAMLRCTTLGGSPDESPQTLCAYDGFHRTSSITDPMGNVTEFAYGNDGSITDSVYGEVNDSPGSSGNVLLARSCHKGDYLPAKGDYLPAHNWRLEIDSSMPTDPFFAVETEDAVITVERFAPGSTAPPTTEVTTIDRSPAGLVQQIRCNGDVLANISYDSAGRSNACWNGACSRSVIRDAKGQILLCGDTDHFSVGGMPGETFTFTRVFDALGRCTQVTDGVGNAAHAAFDSLGRCVSQTEPGGLVVQTAYDGASAAGPFSSQVSADFDGDGDLEVLSSSLVRCGELSRATDSHGFSTTFTSDALGRCVRCDHPDGTFETASFDSRGFQAQATLADGTSRVVTTDNIGRVKTIVLSGSPSGVVAVPQKSMQYDGLGNLTSCVQGASTVTATYDSCGDQTSETQNGRIVSRTFNHRGRTGITYQDGKRFAENRNAFGELVSVSGINPAGVEISPPVVSYDYAGHRVFRSVQRNGVTTTFSYRADGEVSPAGTEDHSFGACVRETITDSSSNVLLDTLVSRDANQRRCTCTAGYYVSGQAMSRSTVTPRDRFGNIASSVIRSGDSSGLPPVVESSVSYVYDPDGTRLSELRSSMAGEYLKSALSPSFDQQMGQYSTWPGGDLTWDSNGNLASFENGTSQLEFVYDAEGRLLACNHPASGGLPAVQVLEFSYDALGRMMVHKLHRGQELISARFIYDGSVCIQELAIDGLADQTFVCADGLRQCISTRNGSILYPHFDGGVSVSASRTGPRTCSCPPGMIRLLTNAGGVPIARYDCDDACKPIFLSSDGVPASDVGPIRWLSPECAWEPEIGMFAGSNGLYSPDLGQAVSASRKKEYVGHVTLMK